MPDFLVAENVPLAPLTTMGVGGPASHYVRAEGAEDVAAAVAWAASHAAPVLVIGGGSNLIVSDAGFPGLVLHVAVRGLAVMEDGGNVVVEAGAGEAWDDVVRLAVDHGAAGIECLAGIPGSVGATPIQNVGAYGQEIAETLVSVDAVDLSSGRSITLDNAACRFRYRDSRFKNEEVGRYAIVRVRYRLKRDGPPVVRYPEIARALEASGRGMPTLADVRDVVLATRRKKSMVVDAADPCSRSVGSFFVNPIVAPAEARQAEDRLRRSGRLAPAERAPIYPAGEGQVKIPAAWLIERAGLERGMRVGAVGLSRNHALAIVNYGGATADEIVAFARTIRDRVREAAGVTLKPEPVFVGVSL